MDYPLLLNALKPNWENFVQHPYHLNLIAGMQAQGITSLVFLLLVLLIFAFVIGGSEVAFFSLTHKDFNVLKTKQQANYKRIIELMEHPKVLLGCLLIAKCLVSISIIIISNMLLSDLINLDKYNAYWMEFSVKWVIIASVIILFGEVMPKVLAAQNNIRFAKDMGGLVELIYLLFSRASIWFVHYSETIEKNFSKSSHSSLEELGNAIDLSTENNTSDNEKNILKGIIKFGNITVKQVMKTRIDVNGIEKNTPYSELISILGEWHYSRLPVYDEDLDKVIGIIHTKDLIPFLDQADDFNWLSLLRPAFFVHEQKLIEDLLREFQSKRIHFAVVVDEFGGTSGIVTLEDVLEEVTGEIRDEFDDEESFFQKEDEHNYVFEGKVMLNDVCKAMNLNPDVFALLKGESDSLAGLVLEIAGNIPTIGETITSGNFSFTVLEAEQKRLLKIKVTIIQQEA